jgi:hypothetical protein
MQTVSGEVDMDYKTYFENTKGVGVLSTAGKDGKVDSAVYSRPHLFEDEHSDSSCGIG